MGLVVVGTYSMTRSRRVGEAAHVCFHAGTIRCKWCGRTWVPLLQRNRMVECVGVRLGVGWLLHCRTEKSMAGWAATR